MFRSISRKTVTPKIESLTFNSFSNAVDQDLKVVQVLEVPSKKKIGLKKLPTVKSSEHLTQDSGKKD